MKIRLQKDTITPGYMLAHAVVLFLACSPTLLQPPWWKIGVGLLAVLFGFALVVHLIMFLTYRFAIKVSLPKVNLILTRKTFYEYITVAVCSVLLFVQNVHWLGAIALANLILTLIWRACLLRENKKLRRSLN